MKIEASMYNPPLSLYAYHNQNQTTKMKYQNICQRQSQCRRWGNDDDDDDDDENVTHDTKKQSNKSKTKS